MNWNIVRNALVSHMIKKILISFFVFESLDFNIIDFSTCGISTTEWRIAVIYHDSCKHLFFMWSQGCLFIFYIVHFEGTLTLIQNISIDLDFFFVICIIILFSVSQERSGYILRNIVEVCLPLIKIMTQYWIFSYNWRNLSSDIKKDLIWCFVSSTDTVEFFEMINKLLKFCLVSCLIFVRFFNIGFEFESFLEKGVSQSKFIGCKFASP